MVGLDMGQKYVHMMISPTKKEVEEALGAAQYYQGALAVSSMVGHPQEEENLEFGTGENRDIRHSHRENVQPGARIQDRQRERQQIDHLLDGLCPPEDDFGAASRDLRRPLADVQDADLGGEFSRNFFL